MALADASTDDTAGAQVSIAFNPAQAERLFEGSGHTLAEMLKIADEGKALPHFPLPTSMKATVAVDSQAVESQNVVGVVKGSDPALADEYVVLTAHLDHVGVGAAINGDGIYNGAMDNASGIATLIESAKVVAAARPKRSVLFVAVTAEEKGLLGSRYFSLHPTVPQGQSGGQHQHGHVPAAVPDEVGDGAGARRVGARRRHPRRGRRAWAWACRPTRSRSATASSAATSTASSARACRRWR